MGLLKQIGRSSQKSLMKSENNIFRVQGDFALGAVSRAKKLGSEKVISEIKKSGLRGRGGAGFPTGTKWEATSCNKNKIKYVVCNAHEGEPQTLKDQFLLENFSHLVLGGMIIAANVIGAKEIYLAVNKRYKEQIKQFKNEIGMFKRKKVLKNISVKIVECENFYVGGEESALLNEIEGRRIEPRQKIPFVCNVGLFGKPTIVNNVETFANVPFIINEGEKKYKKHGTKYSPGQKLVTISGDVKSPGVYEIELGTKLKDIINLAGGAKGKIKFVLTGGYSGTVVTPAKLNTSFEFDSFADGVALGAGTVIVYNDKTNLRNCLKDWLTFYKNESCGQCTPCREGTYRLWEIINKREDKISRSDKNKIDELFFVLENSSFCAFGSSVPMATKGLLEKFEKELISG